MDIFLILCVIAVAGIVFVGTQVVAILFLLKENQRLGEELEKNQPPF